MFAALAVAAQLRMKDFNSQAIANTAFRRRGSACFSFYFMRWALSKPSSITSDALIDTCLILVGKSRQAVAEATAKQANIAAPSAEPRKVQDIAVPTVDANNNGGVQVSLVSTETETTQSNGGAAGVAISTAGVAKGLGNT